MEELTKKFNLIYIFLGIMFVFNLFGTCSSCSTTKKVAKESFDQVYTKEEMDIVLEIQRIKTAKDVLYDWNTVVRTTVRPDDRMNEYDEKIENLEKQLKKLRVEKNNQQVNGGQ